MKHLYYGYMAILMALILLLTTACAPEGVDVELWEDAQSVFTEIDEDIQEGEMPDKDDIRNVDLFVNRYDDAQSMQEESIVQSIAELPQYAEAIYNGDEEALMEYLDFREDIADDLEISIYEFEFIEEE